MQRESEPNPTSQLPPKHAVQAPLNTRKVKSLNQCLALLEPASDRTRSLRPSAPAAWAKYIQPNTRLKRDVALKVLPEAFANDPERIARFQREAEVLAALNHPNIAQVYGVEERALIMERVEGDPLKGLENFSDEVRRRAPDWK
jgi:serine/threonine protein kinase